MAEYQEYMDDYKVPVTAKLLHALPHYNIRFHKINSNFRPYDEKYLESLAILGMIPVVLLIISLLGLLIYLIQQCCKRKFPTIYSITTLKVILSVITFICCLFIGLGLYGNDVLHHGILESFTVGHKVYTVVATVRNQTHILEKTIKNRIRPDLVELANIFDQPVRNYSALSILFVSFNMVQANVTLAVNAINDIRVPLIGVNMTKFLKDGEGVELIRWPVTVLTLSLFVLLCVVLLMGLAKHYRCALIFFSIYGLLAVIALWLMSSLYLSSSVAVSDLCINIEDFLVFVAPRNLPTNVLLEYTKCEPSLTNTFKQYLKESQNSLYNARTAMHSIVQISKKLFKTYGLQHKLEVIIQDFNSCESLLNQLTDLLDCKMVYYNFLAARRGICKESLLGLSLMFMTSFIAAILFTIMVWLASHTWIYIKKHNKYNEVDALQTQQQILIALKTLPRDSNGYFRPTKSYKELEKTSNVHQQDMVDTKLLQDSIEEKKV